MEAVYNECVEEMYENDNIVILEQAGFNNTYTLAVSKETQRSMGWKQWKTFRSVILN